MSQSNEVNGTNGGSVGDGATPPSLNILTQYIKDLSFENPNAPAILASMAEPPEIEVSVNVGGEKHGDNDYEVTLSIHAEAKAGSETAFLVELVY